MSASLHVPAVSLVEERPVAEFAERMAAPFSRLLPASAAEARKLQKQLMQAGFRGPDAPAIYRAIQLASMIGFPGAVAFGCAVLAYPLDECRAMDPPCLRNRLLPAALRAGPNDSLAAVARALGIGGCARSDGHFDRSGPGIERRNDARQRGIESRYTTTSAKNSSWRIWRFASDANATRPCATWRSEPALTICAAWWRC